MKTYRALWPMEWHGRLVLQAVIGTMAIVAAVGSVVVGAWGPVLIFTLVAAATLGRVLNFRVYWNWKIIVSDAGVSQIGGLATPDYRANVAWDSVTKWQREKITGRGRPKVRGEHVFRYLIQGDTESRVAWQSNYFPNSGALVAELTAKLGDPKDVK